MDFGIDTSLGAGRSGGLGRFWSLPHLRPPTWSAPHAPQGPAFGRRGSLEVRLAETAKEVRRAQRLRYKVFFREGSAAPSAAARLSRRDADGFDPVCDHLLVFDHDVRPRPFRASRPKVVGAYRLLRRSVAERHGGFYSAGEFDLRPLLDRRPGAEFLELGRSCVLKPYRSKKTVDLLWQGIWAYALRHRVDAMLGCASLDGTDPAGLTLPLSYLHHFAAAPADWRAAAWPARRVPMDLTPREDLDPRAGFKSLPPLIKGYLRVGATFGEGAVVDRAFGVTDVLAIMPVAAMSRRYTGHFAPAAPEAPRYEA